MKKLILMSIITAIACPMINAYAHPKSDDAIHIVGENAHFELNVELNVRPQQSSVYFQGGKEIDTEGLNRTDPYCYLSLEPSAVDRKFLPHHDQYDWWVVGDVYTCNYENYYAVYNVYNWQPVCKFESYLHTTRVLDNFEKYLFTHFTVHRNEVPLEHCNFNGSRKSIGTSDYMSVLPFKNHRKFIENITDQDSSEHESTSFTYMVCENKKVGFVTIGQFEQIVGSAITLHLADPVISH